MTVGRDGLPIISYYYDDSNNPQPGELRAAYCQTFSCTQTITTTINAGGYSGWAGKGNAITIGTDESPFFSYVTEVPYRGLKTLHCANPFCVPYLRRR